MDAGDVVVTINPANLDLVQRAVSLAKQAGAVDADRVLLGELLAMGALYALRLAGKVSSPLRSVPGALQ